MDQRADFITLATPDLDAARAFYVGGLGWTPTLDVPGEIIFFQIGYGTMLGLYEATSFRTDLDPRLVSDPGPDSDTDTPIPISGVTLSHNVGSPDEVDRVIAAATGAGATVIKPPQRASFGGYHGHFADPNGVIWEVAHNPAWRVDENGKVWLGVIDEASGGAAQG